jgi:2-(1,2-epoxy-1,2-dihydrophenyl)acetyl-CoA isomerase
MPHILSSTENNVAWITLNRPEKLNTFSGTMRQDLLAAIEQACNDPAVRVIVLTGAGKAFCAGGDVSELVSGTSRAMDGATGPERPAMAKIVSALHEVDKPVIAAVNGVAAGGGANLALSCDIRIASDKARFGEVFTRRGLYPDWGGAYFLPRIVGYANACELVFSGDVIDAAEAYRIGMVNRLVGSDQLAEFTREFAERIAHNGPLAIALAKQGMRRFADWDLQQALDFEAQALEATLASEDVKEGFNAFLEKREPVFQGR